MSTIVWMNIIHCTTQQRLNKTKSITPTLREHPRISKHSKISFIYSDAQGQTSLLIHQINQFIQQKVDLLIIGTNDEHSVVPVITKAYKTGIPVIILDRGIQGSNYTTFINSDNIKNGKIGAKYIAEKLNGQGLVLLFEGIQEADVTQLRSKGFIDEISKHQGIRLIKRTGNYLRKDALLQMEKLLVVKKLLKMVEIVLMVEY